MLHIQGILRVGLFFFLRRQYRLQYNFFIELDIQGKFPFTVQIKSL